MMDLKSVVAKNIVDLRKSHNWTQTELAQKLNYSDKAVSKWERAESLPDVTVLKQIADLFLVTVDYLLAEEHAKDQAKPPSLIKQIRQNHVIVALLSATLVFLIATIVFVVLGLFSVQLPIWMAYVYAFPVVWIVLIIFNAIWGKRKWNIVFVTMLLWSILLALYLSFRVENIWLIFIIGIPSQVIILLWGKLKPKHRQPERGTLI
jgi:transcriptional regulator with XRE-family HTH domain